MNKEKLKEAIFYEAGYFASHPDAQRAVQTGRFSCGKEHWDAVGVHTGYNPVWVKPYEIDEEAYYLHYPDAEISVCERRDPEVDCAAAHFRRYGNRQGHFYFKRQETERVVVPNWPFRFVTTLDTSYVPALMALLQSLKERAGIPFRFAVIDYGLREEDRELINGMGVDIDWYKREVLGDFVLDPTHSMEPRMRPNLWKPLMWLLPYDETVMYIDSDVLCLNSLQGIYDLVSLSVVVNQSSVATCNPDSDKNYRPSGYLPFNAGIMVYRPNVSVFYEMQKFAGREYLNGVIRYGDQIVQNDFFSFCRPEMLHYMNVNWNFSVLLSHQQPHLYNPTHVRFLHWAQEAKPWTHEPPFEWQSVFWDLWQGFYKRAGG